MMNFNEMLFGGNSNIFVYILIDYDIGAGQTAFRHRGSPIIQQGLQQMSPMLQQSGIQSAQMQQPIYNKFQQQPYGPQIGPRYISVSVLKTIH